MSSKDSRMTSMTCEVNSSGSEKGEDERVSKSWAEAIQLPTRYDLSRKGEKRNRFLFQKPLTFFIS